MPNVSFLNQLCIKNFTITTPDGDLWEFRKGTEYSTSIPNDDKSIKAFAIYSVDVPKELFVNVNKPTTKNRYY